MSLKLAIWDVDGTIVDSRATIATCIDRAFERLGLAPPGYERTRLTVGLGLVEAITALAPPGTREGTIHDLAAAYKQVFVAYRSQPEFSEQLYDGALQTLEKFANDNWLLAISTGKSRRGLETVLATHDLAKYFDTIWCADDGPGKPDPFMCLEAMGAVGAETHQTLMIGDAIHDMRMAKSAGISAFGVSWGFATPAELTAAGADQVFSHFDDLNAICENFFREIPEL